MAKNNIDFCLCSVEQLSLGVEEMAEKKSNLEEEEAAWPSGQCVRLAIRQSWVRVPHWPLAGFVLRDQKFVFSGESPRKQEFPPDLVTVHFIVVSINVSKTRVDCTKRCWGGGGLRRNVLGSKLQNLSIHVLRRKLCHCLHFTIVFAIILCLSLSHFQPIYV